MTDDISPENGRNEVSLADAAAFLGISHLHAAKLITSGILPSRVAGTDHSVRMTDLVAYKRTVDQRHAFLDELAAETQEAGLYDEPPTRFVR